MKRCVQRDDVKNEAATIMQEYDKKFCKPVGPDKWKKKKNLIYRMYIT